MPRVAIFRHVLEAASEPYIATQASFFEKCEVGFFGVNSAADNPPITANATLLAHERPAGRTQAALFKLTRRSPKLIDRLRQFSPFVILAHFAQDAWRIAPAARATGIPLVAVCHGSDVLVADKYAPSLGWSARQLRGNWHRLAEEVDLFLPVSEHVAEALRGRGIPDHKIHTHYIGTVVDHHDIHQDVERNGILFVGRLVATKGVEHLIRACQILQADGILPRVTVIGDGPDRTKLRELSLRAGISDRVTFTGFLRPDAVGDAMREHAVLCVPSVETRNGASEGFGLVALEAQARGLPVVAFATGGLPEAVAHGVGGLLVAPGDVLTLAHLLGTLTSNRHLQAQLSQGGLNWVRTRFDMRQRSRELESHLLERFDRRRSV